ncbi:MerR family transcriptional regulator [Streptomyces sp. SBT349]|uniref:MerR family transcriptional regulator n=1 Tax=Streptomyces sp. SBT349 TaxID=1580539 RepID=UPI001F3DCCC2|nr:MerR family transcriptional regulator [Streptomyces sp. SBT349]
MSISELAAALGVRPSTLRHWHAEALVTPDRDPVRRTRRYTPAQVRDARIVLDAIEFLVSREVVRTEIRGRPDTVR